jgi:putative hydrolase of the HAD superfamily
VNEGIVQWIGFDADDTLWQNEIVYRRARASFEAMMAKYGDTAGLDELVGRTEVENIPFYGYGAVGFALSLIEAGIKKTDGRLSSADVQLLINLSKEMIETDLPLMDGALEIVSELADQFPLLLITKGDLRHQRAKVEASGLRRFFRAVEVVPEKKPDDYLELLHRNGVDANSFLMIGNSMRSDILPVLAIGGSAILVTNELTWQYEAVDAPQPDSSRYIGVDHLSELPSAIRSLTSGR